MAGKQRTSKPRPSKLARENSLSAAEEQEIQEAFSLFVTTNNSSSNGHKRSQPQSNTIPVENLRRVLIALSLTPSPSELQEYISTLDPEGEGFIEYEPFVAVCALKMHSQVRSNDDHEREVNEAWNLFTREGEDRITLAGLKRISRNLGEEVSDEVLRDMILEANGGVGLARGVEKYEFEIIMKRAGVWR